MSIHSLKIIKILQNSGLSLSHGRPSLCSSFGFWQESTAGHGTFRPAFPGIPPVLLSSINLPCPCSSWRNNRMKRYLSLPLKWQPYHSPMLTCLPSVLFSYRWRVTVWDGHLKDLPKDQAMPLGTSGPPQEESHQPGLIKVIISARFGSTYTKIGKKVINLGRHWVWGEPPRSSAPSLRAPAPLPSSSWIPADTSTCLHSCRSWCPSGSESQEHTLQPCSPGPGSGHKDPFWMIIWLFQYHPLGAHPPLP